MACGRSHKSLGRFCCVTPSLDEDSDVCRDPVSPMFPRCEVGGSQSGLTSTENDDSAQPEGPPGESGGRSARTELAQERAAIAALSENKIESTE